MNVRILTAIAGCAVASCVGLAGCSGQTAPAETSDASSPAVPSAATAGETGAAAGEEALIGVWDLQNVDEVFDAAVATTDIESSQMSVVRDLFKQMCFMNVNDDGTFQFVALSSKAEGTWELADGKLLAEADGDSYEFAYDGETLEFDNGGLHMVLARTGDTAREIPSDEEIQEALLELMGVGTESESTSASSSGSNSSSSSSSFGSSYSNDTDDDFYVSDEFETANGTGYQGSDGNYYFRNDDGSYEATDGYGNGVRDSDGDGEIDYYTDDGGETWHSL